MSIHINIRKGTLPVRILLRDNNMASYYGRGFVKQITLNRAYLQGPEKDSVEFEMLQVNPQGNVTSLGMSKNGVWNAFDGVQTPDKGLADYANYHANLPTRLYWAHHKIGQEYVHLPHYQHLVVRMTEFLSKDRVVEFTQECAQVYDSESGEPLEVYIHPLPESETSKNNSE